MMLREKGTKFTIGIDVTSDCNLRCPYCFQLNSNWGSIPAPPTNYPVLEIMEKYRDVLEEYVSVAGVKDYSVEVRLSGGEPFLEKHLLLQYVDYAKSIFGKDVNIVILTNGTIIDFDIIDELADNTYLGIIITPHVLWLRAQNFAKYRDVVVENVEYLYDLMLKEKLSVSVDLVLSPAGGVDVSAYPKVFSWLLGLRRQHGIFTISDGTVGVLSDIFSRMRGDSRLVHIYQSLFDAALPIFKYVIEERGYFDATFYSGIYPWFIWASNHFANTANFGYCHARLKSFSYFTRSGHVTACPFFTPEFLRKYSTQFFTIDDFLRTPSHKIVEVWDDTMFPKDLLERYANLSAAKIFSLCGRCRFHFCPATAFRNEYPQPITMDTAKTYVAVDQAFLSFHEALVDFAVSKGYSIHF